MRACVWTFVFALAVTVSATPAWAAGGAVTTPAMSCDALEKVDLAGAADKTVRIVSATQVVSKGVTVCEVRGAIEPQIGFFVRLPIATWTGRFLQIGCGGLCGRLPDEYAQVTACAPLQRGEFAVAGTDMGHQGMAPDFGDVSQLRVDFAYRGVHETALVAKALIRAFYGKAPTRSYFSGCSDGGREALIEAERYPEDFDGITAGAPAANFLVQNTFYHGWNARSNTGSDGKPILTPADLPILHKAALTACRAVQGVIEDPLRCSFDPGVVECKPGETADCLSGEKVAAARKIYDGPRDAAGLPLTPGGPMPGSELAWEGVYVPKAGSDAIFSRMIAEGTIDHLALAIGQKGGGIAGLTYDRAFYARMLPQHSLYDATNPDLAAFAKRGGKLIIWHGYSDQHISPTGTIEYFDAVKSVMGPDMDKTVRFFFFPGMYHCHGGEGPTNTDVLSPVMSWVEDGQAPDALVLRDEKSARVVFSYPAVAIYDGRNDRANPASYEAIAPTSPYQVRKWIGQELFTSASFTR